MTNGNVTNKGASKAKVATKNKADTSLDETGDYPAPSREEAAANRAAAQAEREHVAAMLNPPAALAGTPSMQSAAEKPRVPAVTTEAEYDANGVTLTAVVVRFADGASERLGMNSLNSALLARAMAHGFNAKLVDGAAIAKNPETGRSATLADKKAAVLAIVEQLRAGEWNRRREAGEGAGTGGLFFTAVCRLYPQRDAATIRQFLDGKSKEEIAAMRKSAKVIEMMAKVKAEQGPLTPEKEADLFAGL